jgi:hypothetical protein
MVAIMWRIIRVGSSGRRERFFPLLAALAMTAFAPAAVADDATIEAAAGQAIASAARDVDGKALGKALYRLGNALRACGKDRCSNATQGAILRDIGSIRVRQRDKKSAAKLFARAIALAPELELNAAYDTADVRAAWESAGGTKKATQPTAPPRAAASFTHVPALEQQAATPLPVYVEGGGDGVSRVVVHYQDASMTSWKEVLLERLGGGWGGAIPCADVALGAMRYYVEGFDSEEAKVSVGGDAEHPFEVPIRPTITSEAPHLPGAIAPNQCTQPSVAPEALSAVEGAHPTGSGLREGAPAPVGRGRLHRFWFGLAGNIDFMNVPQGDNLCARDRSTGRPANASNLYCTTLDGVDFPPASVASGVAGQLGGGHSDGGLQLGVVRYMATFDYASTNNLLLGVRVGVVVNRYPGSDAFRDGRAFRPAIHAELRATWVFGHEPLVGSHVAPVVYLAGGVSEFEARVKSTAVITQGIPPAQQTVITVPVNIWRTDGPWFAAAGLGLRFSLRSTIAITPAVRGNLAVGGNGVLPAFGPELTAQVGF